MYGQVDFIHDVPQSPMLSAMPPLPTLKLTQSEKWSKKIEVIKHNLVHDHHGHPVVKSFSK